MGVIRPKPVTRGYCLTIATEEQYLPKENTASGVSREAGDQRESEEGKMKEVCRKKELYRKNKGPVEIKSQHTKHLTNRNPIETKE
jgi:hypothetical protein